MATVMLSKHPKALYTAGDLMSDSPRVALLAAELTQSSSEQGDGRCCDFCFATSTPMWRRGPGGTGTLCNACGVRWSLKRSKPDAQEYIPDAQEHRVASAKPLHRSIDRIPASPQAEEMNKHISLDRDMSPPAGEVQNAVFYKRNEITGLDEEFYFCKYCNQQWPSSHFRNRQQFGAHCSNCSRKRKVGPFGPDEKMSPIPTRMRRKKKKGLNGSSSGLHDDLDDTEISDSDSADRSTISASGSRDTHHHHHHAELSVREKLTLLLTSAQLEMLRRDECTQRSELQKRLATLNAEIAQRRSYAAEQIHALEVQLERELSQLTSIATAQLTTMLESLRAECATADALLEQLSRTQESFDRLLVSVRQIPPPSAEPAGPNEEATISSRIEELEAAMGTLEGQLAKLEAMYIERMQNVDRLRKALLDTLESKAAQIEQMIEAHRSQLLRLLDSNRLVLLVIFFHLKSSSHV